MTGLWYICGFMLQTTTLRSRLGIGLWDIRMFKKILLFICLLNLTACGFHLRGTTATIPESSPIRVLYLQTPDPYGQLSRNLRQYLKMSGITLTKTPQEAKTILTILSEEESQQLLSVSGTQQTRQYNLVLTVTFELSDPKNNLLLVPQKARQSRTLTIQSNQVLAGSNESANLYHQMRKAIVPSIVNRIASRAITSLLVNP
jgi:LPS-assembly lipoprotein